MYILYLAIKEGYYRDFRVSKQQKDFSRPATRYLGINKADKAACVGDKACK